MSRSLVCRRDSLLNSAGGLPPPCQPPSRDLSPVMSSTRQVFDRREVRHSRGNTHRVIRPPWHVDGGRADVPSARLWLAGRADGRQREPGALSVSVVSAAPTQQLAHAARCCCCCCTFLRLHPSSRLSQYHCAQYIISLLRKPPAMDATIYQIIFGELADLNCTLIDALQDTFMENASLSLQSIDGIFYLKKEERIKQRLFLQQRINFKASFFLLL